MTKTTIYYRKRDFFIEAYKKSGCNIGAACRSVRIARSTFNLWMREYSRFKEDVETAEQELYDFVESKAIEKIRDGDTKMIMFYLKTKVKNRGYTVRTEVISDVCLGVSESERLQKIVEELKNGDK
jgi:hypothetical protein